MNILFIVSSSFPYGMASSSRALNLVRLIIAAGHKVHVVADSLSKESVCLENLSYEAFKSESSNCDFANKLEETILKIKPNIIISNSNFKKYKDIIKYTIKYDIKLIMENCEWYDSSNFRFGKYDTRFKENEKMLTEGFTKADGFISISRFLDNHKMSLGKKSIRIPTILDVENTDYGIHVLDNRINIIYTGRPGVSKEYLKPILKALNKRYFSGKFIFHIYGPSVFQVLRNINFDLILLLKVWNSVRIHGYCEQSIVYQRIKEADFQIFLRPYRKSSNAGFPTKLGESTCVGTPVITNDTGDIGMYLHDNVNGFLLDNNTVNAVEDCFYKILKLDDSKYQEIRMEARKTAELYFDYRKYVVAFSDFIENL